MGLDDAGPVRLRDFASRTGRLPTDGRRLLCVIARQTRSGSLRSKPDGVATMPEIHEACGLGVDELYALLAVLKDAGFLSVEGDYPFEEIRLGEEERRVLALLLQFSEGSGITLEEIVVEQRFDRVG